MATAIAEQLIGSGVGTEVPLRVRGRTARPKHLPPRSPYDLYSGITPSEWERLVIQDAETGIPLEDNGEWVRLPDWAMKTVRLLWMVSLIAGNVSGYPGGIQRLIEGYPQTPDHGKPDTATTPDHPVKPPAYQGQSPDSGGNGNGKWLAPVIAAATWLLQACSKVISGEEQPTPTATAEIDTAASLENFTVNQLPLNAKIAEAYLAQALRVGRLADLGMEAARPAGTQEWLAISDSENSVYYGLLKHQLPENNSESILTACLAGKEKTEADCGFYDLKNLQQSNPFEGPEWQREGNLQGMEYQTIVIPELRFNPTSNQFELTDGGDQLEFTFQSLQGGILADGLVNVRLVNNGRQTLIGVDVEDEGLLQRFRDWFLEAIKVQVAEAKVRVTDTPEVKATETTKPTVTSEATDEGPQLTQDQRIRILERAGFTVEEWNSELETMRSLGKEIIWPLVSEPGEVYKLGIESISQVPQEENIYPDYPDAPAIRVTGIISKSAYFDENSREVFMTIKTYNTEGIVAEIPLSLYVESIDSSTNVRIVFSGIVHSSGVGKVEALAKNMDYYMQQLQVGKMIQVWLIGDPWQYLPESEWSPLCEKYIDDRYRNREELIRICVESMKEGAERWEMYHPSTSIIVKSLLDGVPVPSDTRGFSEWTIFPTDSIFPTD